VIALSRLSPGRLSRRLGEPDSPSCDAQKSRRRHATFVSGSSPGTMSRRAAALPSRRVGVKRGHPAADTTQAGRPGPASDLRGPAGWRKSNVNANRFSAGGRRTQGAGAAKTSPRGSRSLGRPPDQVASTTRLRSLLPHRDVVLALACEGRSLITKSSMQSHLSHVDRLGVKRSFHVGR
jgi:hypothetical protein